MSVASSAGQQSPLCVSGHAAQSTRGVSAPLAAHASRAAHAAEAATAAPDQRPSRRTRTGTSPTVAVRGEGAAHATRVDRTKVAAVTSSKLTGVAHGREIRAVDLHHCRRVGAYRRAARGADGKSPEAPQRHRM